jgi:hypothetical protein
MGPRSTTDGGSSNGKSVTGCPSEVYAVGVDGGIFRGDGLSYQQAPRSMRDHLLATHGLLDGGI